ARVRGELLRALAGDDGVDAAERGGLREHAERALLQITAVVLEKDERRHQMSLFSARKSTIACAALPSSSIFRASPRAGGLPSARTVVREPASPTSPASTPRSASERTSCGFFFAPMIPFSDG